MKSIKIIEIEPREGLTLKAIEVNGHIEHMSPCCNVIYSEFYCQNRIISKCSYYKCDASGDVVFNEKMTVVEEYIVIPEFDAILSVAEGIDFSKLDF